MSPEQVRGEELDARTDLFSFALVLYEMVTGQQAFSGNTAALACHAILNRTPVPARQLNRELPPALEEVISKALEKDREARYRAASDMRADLERLHPTREAALLRRWWVAASAFALLLAAIALFWFTGYPPSSQNGLPALKQRQLTTNYSENPLLSGAISPDGKYLAYADLQGLHIKVIESGQTHTVPQPDTLRGRQVNWKIVSTSLHDGSGFIANANEYSALPGGTVSSGGGSVWRVPLMGGPPRKLRDNAVACSVSRDGSWVVLQANYSELGVGYREMWIMRPDGGQRGGSTKATRTSASRGQNGHRMAGAYPSNLWSGQATGSGGKW